VLNGGVILIATPDGVTGRAIVDHLAGLGYGSVVVGAGGDALLSVVEKQVGLAVVDLALEEPCGKKVLEILRKMRPRLPLIVLSGDSSVETGREILQHGPFYYLIKPVNLEELGQYVRIALARNRRILAEPGGPWPARRADSGRDA
jgi:DNA-binding response OmpR family regulator